MIYFLYEILNFEVYFFQLRDNNIVESEYVGWAIQPITNPVFLVTADVARWENNSESMVMKKFTVKMVDKRMCRYSRNSPIICVVQVDNNETLSEVSEILHLVIQLK